MNDTLIELRQRHSAKNHPMGKMSHTLEVRTDSSGGVAAFDQVLDVRVGEMIER